MRKILLKFWIFNRECCGLSRPSVSRMQRKFSFVLGPGPAVYFIYLNSIFHLQIPPMSYFFAIIRQTESSSAYPSSRLSCTCLNSFHSNSAPAVHSGCSRNKDVCKGLSYILFHLASSYFIR